MGNTAPDDSEWPVCLLLSCAETHPVKPQRFLWTVATHSEPLKNVCRIPWIREKLVVFAIRGSHSWAYKSWPETIVVSHHSVSGPLLMSSIEPDWHGVFFS